MAVLCIQKVAATSHGKKRRYFPAIMQPQRLGPLLSQLNFEDNTAFTYGGAVYVTDHSDITRTGEAYFFENIACAGSGGALYVTLGGDVSLKGITLFCGNMAFQKGDALYLSSGLILWTRSIYILGNTVNTNIESGDYIDSSLYTSSSWGWSYCVSPWSSDDYSYDYSDSSGFGSFWLYDDSYVGSSGDASESGALYVGNGSHVAWSSDTYFSEYSTDIGVLYSSRLV